MTKLTHLDENNRPKMVAISDKRDSTRTALAKCLIVFPDEVAKTIRNGEIEGPKGAVFHTAIIAGTMAAKETARLIPFCHPLSLESCDISIELLNQNTAEISCFVKTMGKTGVEMEALTGANIAALTVYDMCKALSHEMVIERCYLVSKEGGKRTVKEGKLCQN